MSAEPQKAGITPGGRAGRVARRQERVLTFVLYLSMAVAVLLALTMFAGAAAYIGKTFYDIPPRWMFGLFD